MLAPAETTQETICFSDSDQVYCHFSFLIKPGENWCLAALTFCFAICFSLTPEANLLEEFIESQLKLRHSELVQWFREVELPRIAGFFIPLLKKWSMEYAGRFAQNSPLLSTKCFFPYRIIDALLT